VSPTLSRRRLLQLAGGLGASGLLAHATGLDDSVLDRVRCGRRITPDWTYRPTATTLNFSVPTLLAGELYVTPGFGFTAEDRSTYLVGLDATTGSEYWRFENEKDGIGRPLVTDGRVYVGTGSDRVYALDAGSGAKLWTYSAGGEEVYGGGAWGRPAEVEGAIVVGISHSESSRASPSDPSAFTHRVVGIEHTTGTERWAVETARAVSAGPVVVGTTVIVGTEGGRLIGIAARDGTERWRVPVGGTFDDPPVRLGRTVVATNGQRVAAVDADSGDTRWLTFVEADPAPESYNADTAPISTGVAVVRNRFADGPVVAGTRDGDVCAFDSEDGHTQWRVSVTDDGAVGAVDTTEEHVVAVTTNGRVVLLSPEDGRVEARALFVERRYENRCGVVGKYVQGVVATERAIWVSLEDGLFRIPMAAVRESLFSPL
jgi:outer membrane protein assembly factor BamB